MFPNRNIPGLCSSPGDGYNSGVFSLQKLLGQEEKVFQLLEAGAQEARRSVQALVRISKALDEPLVLDEFRQLRLIDKKITQEIGLVVYTTFVTALDREDIEALADALYKVPKLVDKFAERLLLSPLSVRKIDFSAQIGLLDRATDLVVEMVWSLRRQNLIQIKDLIEKLQHLESEADEEMVGLYRGLYNGAYEILETIALKDLYEQLEKVLDRCSDVGEVIARIALKNS